MNIIILCNVLHFPGTEIDCRIGDGNGYLKTRLKGTYTVQECVAEVRKQYPNAKGASMDFDCPNKCSCTAEMDMNDWRGSNYQACLFAGQKNISSIGLHQVAFDAAKFVYVSYQSTPTFTLKTYPLMMKFSRHRA